MRIGLETNLSEKDLSYLNGEVGVVWRGKGIKVQFIIDTGSPRNVLSYSDAKRLGVKLNLLKEGEVILIGGGRHQSYMFEGFEVIFIAENGLKVKDRIDVRILVSGENGEDKIPFILGTDFLREKKYKLFCDLANDIAFLEKDSEFLTAA